MSTRSLPRGREAILDALLAGELKRDDALQALEGEAVERLGYARLDHDRAERRGFPEVIYAPGKRPEQVADLFGRLAERNPNVLCTRAGRDAAESVLSRVGEAEYDPSSRLVWLWRDRKARGLGEVLVLSGGTADQGVANEALQCARVMGNRSELLADIGVAGLHRLTSELERLREARVLICVAGFEAALPSVVAGLVDRPVIGVPTSVGYGASFQGIAPLLTMLNSCVPGVAVVNIDNGFGAGYLAHVISRSARRS